ncbi:MAG: hypothetical protein IIC74_04685 [Bacteroidetes bacterium]|nr:hypothetical protein [Bacteroidota bacterium]
MNLFKNVFLLSKREGLSNIEISEHLNVSQKTVEAHITKAFCLIRERVNYKISKKSFSPI